MTMRMIMMAKISANSHPPHEFQWKGRLLSLLFSFSFPLIAPHKSWQRWKTLILQFTITCFTCIARLCFLHCSWSCGRALAKISKKRKIRTMSRSILITLRKKTFGFSVVPSTSVSLVIGSLGWQTNIFNLEVSIDLISRNQKSKLITRFSITWFS